jgi:scyllo-inosose 3-dehydrogenase
MKAAQLRATWSPRPGYEVSESEQRTQRARVASSVWKLPELVAAEVPSPDPGPHEVVVRVIACGVCGSDTHCIETDKDGYVLFSGPARFPCVLGHEYAGQVVAVSKEATTVRVGDHVTCEGMLYCGVCEACRAGLYNQCINLSMVGFSSPGAFADYITVHEKHCWRIDGIAERFGDAQKACEVAALVEPVACSYNGIFVAGGGRFVPGSHVAIFGCGPIGLGAIALARIAGAASIIAFDTVESRRTIAATMGADEVLDPVALTHAGSSPSHEIWRVTKGWGVDVAVEAAGAGQQTFPEMERALAPAGRIVYLGRTGDRVPVTLDRLVSGASMISGARGHAGRRRRVPARHPLAREGRA